ncbi:hypothetical protein PV726_32585 [Streptomyces europaeiscabiei]|uniref:hypothetical protein n=1 Tax=Streptomyces europaeiscabiei TaxID=146819 RepID=UPI0029BCB5ED|nr:hypothetical protein [Streptomyces europaeiscabiei]MDX3694996.1 hypothetical protein [Streptomyces europaeiscabiei]
MNHLPLTEHEVGALALSMIDLRMMHAVEGVPKEPDLIEGREGECIAAELGLPVVALDDALRAYVDERRRFLSWYPTAPLGISAHKLASTGWVVSAPEIRAALAVLDRSSTHRVSAVTEGRFGSAGVNLERWDDWTKLLRGSADSGYPILFGPATYDGPWALAELLLDRDWRSA